MGRCRASQPPPPPSTRQRPPAVSSTPLQRSVCFRYSQVPLSPTLNDLNHSFNFNDEITTKSRRDHQRDHHDFLLPRILVQGNPKKKKKYPRNIMSKWRHYKLPRYRDNASLHNTIKYSISLSLRHRPTYGMPRGHITGFTLTLAAKITDPLAN